MSEPLPVCEHADQLREMDGRRVRLVGTYRAVPTLKKMPRPGRPPETADLGHVVIVLDSAGTPAEDARVALGKSARPPEETAELDGRRVTVEGELVLSPDPGAPGAARRPTPVLMDPTVPRLVEGR